MSPSLMTYELKSEMNLIMQQEDLDLDILSVVEVIVMAEYF